MSADQAESPTTPASAGTAQPGDASYLRLMRHELRTPVNHIIGYGEMLLEELGPAAPPSPHLRQLILSAHQLLDLLAQTFAAADGDAAALGALLAGGRAAASVAAIAEQADAAEAQLGAEHAALQPDLARIGAAAARLRELLADGLSEAEIQASAPLSERAPEAAAAPAHGTLLVVEDNEQNRDLLARRLHKLGYHVLEAEHGRRALELLADQPCDLILLDIMMPEMDGYATLAALKADEQLRHVPVIMLSALDDLSSVVRCIEMGADDYLPKPGDPVLLSARIGASLEKKRLRDQEQAMLTSITAAKRRADDLLHVVIPLGVALSSEKAYDRLLERIVIESMGLCNADGGSLYIRTDADKLEFVILRNRSLQIAMGGASGVPISFPPLAMYDAESGAPNDRYVVTQAALSRRAVVVDDAYAADGFDFSGTRAFDQQTGYRSTSFLAVPLLDTIGRVIGVLQLLNAQSPATGAVMPFDAGMRETIESLSALATAALTNYEREQRLRDQIASMQIAIDEEKRRREVAQITESDYFQRLRERARELRSSHPAPRPPAEPAAEPGEAHPAEAADPLLGPLRERERQRHKRVYSVGGQEIHVQEEGPPDGEIALLIHGWSSSWYAMSPLLPLLRQRHRCIAVDLPGYGDSPRMPQRTTIAGYADLLADLIRQISPRPVVLVGHSMGGMISVTLALRHPELVERMVLLCPTISGNLSTRINIITWFTGLERFAIANRLVAALEPQLLSVTDALMRPASFAERTGIQEKDYHQLRADARRPGQGLVRAECFWAMRDSDLRGQLGKIAAPALILWGMEDNTVPLRDASVVADEWPDAELRVIPKAGHWPQFETPDFTQRAIRAFLSTPIKLLKVQF